MPSWKQPWRTKLKHGLKLPGTAWANNSPPTLKSGAEAGMDGKYWTAVHFRRTHAARWASTPDNGCCTARMPEIGDLQTFPIVASGRHRFYRDLTEVSGYELETAGV